MNIDSGLKDKNGKEVYIGSIVKQKRWKNIRINNIECRKYNNQSFYEIVLWERESDYNKLYIGYLSAEYCSTIAFLRKKEDWYLESVGSRICDLSDEDLSDFIKVYKKANKKLNKL